MKGANRYMKIVLVFFGEKVHLGQYDLFSLYAIFLLFDFGMVKLSQATAHWILKQDMIKILKQ